MGSLSSVPEDALLCSRIGTKKRKTLFQLVPTMFRHVPEGIHGSGRCPSLGPALVPREQAGAWAKKPHSAHTLAHSQNTPFHFT